MKILRLWNGYRSLGRIFRWEIFQNLVEFTDFAMMLKFSLVFSEYFLKYLEISWDFLKIFWILSEVYKEFQSNLPLI
jgi:hypothetical protein